MTNRRTSMVLILTMGLLTQVVISCMERSNRADQSNSDIARDEKYNPVVYFEIPVTDIERAIQFYKTVFHFDFKREIIDGNELALFPFTEDHLGISGALAKGEIYKPTKDGVVIYIKATDIDETLQRVVDNGGQILYPKTSNGDLGYVAEFEDSEGNRIALHQSANGRSVLPE